MKSPASHLKSNLLAQAKRTRAWSVLEENNTYSVSIGRKVQTKHSSTPFRKLHSMIPNPISLSPNTGCPRSPCNSLLANFDLDVPYGFSLQRFYNKNSGQEEAISHHKDKYQNKTITGNIISLKSTPRLSEQVHYPGTHQQ